MASTSVQKFKKLLDSIAAAESPGSYPKEIALEVLETIEKLFKETNVSPSPQLFHQYLNETGDKRFLLALESSELLLRWAETVFQAIQQSQYSLLDLFSYRVQQRPDRILFQDMTTFTPRTWTYKQVNRFVQEIAAVFYSAGRKQPRVAIFAENCPEGACCDLACLFYDILNTPLNIHFNTHVLIDLFNRLEINIVVTDSYDRYVLLKTIQKKVKKSFIIFLLNPRILPENSQTRLLEKECRKLNLQEVNSILNERQRKPVKQVATVMFTSGSTGQPKGVCFSIYHLVAKRFARAAALPEAGDEVFLCYLPLYHTFGRYLEMLGAIYWRGTYIFTGNPSSETLLSLFPKINPTAFISIPLRWIQLQEKAFENMSVIPNPNDQSVGFRNVVGDHLEWGLSAAGYLDPKIFQFFQRNGVELCSGFGMTEATGGITMTPPGQYIENTTGIALPGLNIRLNKKSEMEISGHYLARYLDDVGPDGIIPYPHEEDYWLETGDIFRQTSEGYFQIVDRVKDIYKNIKGQTIAPLKVEKKFIGVPGIKRTFLVGDSRAYNVLFIIPDDEDPVIQNFQTKDNRRDYFHQLITTANQDLAPYERVINFMELYRDFETSKKELTSKGSFNRKTIEQNFATQIDELYQSPFITLTFQAIQIRIPRWFLRDLGILQGDIVICLEGLRNRVTNRILPIKKHAGDSVFQIGDLEYQLDNPYINMGLFSRQPRLWLGNPSLVAFCPCKEGWDAKLNNVSTQVFRPWKGASAYSKESLPKPERIRDSNLLSLNQLLSEALFCDFETVHQALQKISDRLEKSEPRNRGVMRRRLEALARHPEEQIRCLAYRILLLDKPSPDYGKSIPAFVKSGLTFLNEKSMEFIAFKQLEIRRLDALRQRLFTYRVQLDWPIGSVTRKQFENIFKMLIRFVEQHPEFYNSIRAELASWILHKPDPKLSEKASQAFSELHRQYEARLIKATASYTEIDWASKLVFDDGLSQLEVARIEKVLTEKIFLKQSIMLAFDEKTFDLKNVPPNGIWISRIQSSYQIVRYRVCVNTNQGKHFNLQLILRENLEAKPVLKSIHWMAAIAGYPFGPPVLPHLGCYRPELGARSVAYQGKLTVWERVRQYSSVREQANTDPDDSTWQNLFIPALAVFFRGWQNSGYNIVPGAVSPGNVASPERDFREGALIESLTGWYHYTNTLSLIKPMIQNFYFKTAAHYPWFKNQLNINWIFDACVEGLGMEKAFAFFNSFQKDLENEEILIFNDKPMSEVFHDYMKKVQMSCYIPLPLRNAVKRYEEWESVNRDATFFAREQTVLEVNNLYRLNRFSELIRYHLYRHTYFKRANKRTQKTFDGLLKSMFQSPDKPAIRQMMLSDLQDAIQNKDDREVFSRMVFP